MAHLRGFLPDAVDQSRVILLKACALLRLTYEIRLATYMAVQSGKTLVLGIPAAPSLSPPLIEFVDEMGVSDAREPLPRSF
jgi:hypothetical protein